jgi:hypothetical protein
VLQIRTQDKVQRLKLPLRELDARRRAILAAAPIRLRVRNVTRVRLTSTISINFDSVQTRL